MTKIVKIKRELISSFLIDVSNCINKPFKDTKSDVFNVLNKIKQIQTLIEDQDDDSIKNNKFKQNSFLW